jgi:alginate O-acetyltransferase complex protein AlgI
MIFNSLNFAIFLPIVLALYYASGHKFRNWILLVAGYVFYGAWDIRFLFLVSLSTVLDYCTGLMIGKGRMSLVQRLAPSIHLLGFALVFLLPDWHGVKWNVGTGINPGDWSRLFTPTAFGLRVMGLTVIVVALAHLAYPFLVKLPESKKRLFFLRCSLVGQLGMLGVFKYYNFFIDSADHLAAMLGLNATSLHLDIILPIGISFYTFQTLSYVCDVYWRRMEPVAHLRDFALFVGYFPPLVAGPIERASHLIPRILEVRRITFNQVAQGGYLILLGLVKKMAIADGLADSVSSVYNSTGAVGWSDVVVGTAAFSIQIYGDFSGYSDIASGVSLWFGIALLQNFNQPYFSINPAEFWRRWHISLSTWLRDYLYIPLGGNRGSEAKTKRNLLVTMVLGGLWHGAAWNFILWGLYQGILLVVYRTFAGEKPKLFEGPLLARLPRMALFFVFVCFGWLLFRANSFGQIIDFTRILLTDFSDLTLHMKRPPLVATLGVLVLVLIEIAQFKAQMVHFYARLPVFAHGAIYAMLATLFLMGLSNGAQQFIYFQF